MTPPSDLPVVLAPSTCNFRLLTDDERQASLDRFLSSWLEHNDVWVFGYGSLVWRPEFAYVERRPALLKGYHRALCLWSRVNRGTPERPGLVFGLDIGGSCRGVAYRIQASEVRNTFTELWKREMPTGAYIPKWLSTRTPEGDVQSLVFTIDRQRESYARGLTPLQLIQVVSGAQGTYGHCAEYVLETSRALREAGIRDRRLEAFANELQQALQGA